MDLEGSLQQRVLEIEQARFLASNWTASNTLSLSWWTQWNTTICLGASPIDFGNECVRDAWTALVPAAVVFAFCVASFPSVQKILKWIGKPIEGFISLEEAEILDGADVKVTDSERSSRLQGLFWRQAVLVSGAVVELVIWTTLGAFNLFVLHDQHRFDMSAVKALLIASTWLYAAVRPVVSPPLTPPYDLFTLFAVHLIVGGVQIGGLLVDWDVFGVPIPDGYVMGVHIFNLVLLLVLIAVILGMPIGIPSERVSDDDIGKSVCPEDYTTLWEWLTFHWVYSVIRKGTNETLSEDDVWNLSPSMRSRPVYLKFKSMFAQTSNSGKPPSLLWRLFRANTLDFFLDCQLTLVAVVFNYASPYFLNQILSAIADPSPVTRSKAYIYALLAFVCTVIKAELEMQHLWFSRRAAVRIRSQLMAAIYDKALKRRDFSGIVEKDAEKADAKGKAKESSDEPKAGADVGKIVNLMASDAGRLSNTASGLYFIYGSPFEVVVACVFLYNVLGWSAFAGFVVMLIGSPLNSLFVSWNIRINKKLSIARDKRMAVLNELITSVKFIKFFAWEDRWIEKALDSRRAELRLIINTRINSMCISALWSALPILVSVTSFAVYVVNGGELTVAKAFTAIALFNMIRRPLNIVPAWVVIMLQARVSLDRISTFLDEDEVGGQVSSLKEWAVESPVSLSGTKDVETNPPHKVNGHGSGRFGDALDANFGYNEFGLRNATFVWNSVKEAEKVEKAGWFAFLKRKKTVKVEPNSERPNATTGSPTSDRGVSESDTLVDHRLSVTLTPTPGSEGQGQVDGEEDRRFELKDISVVFPEGELTVVTGPTASGKTALLLSVLGELTLTSGTILMRKDPTKTYPNGLSHTISYSAQTPWLQHQSIKENILFSSPFDAQRYVDVVEACALKPDFNILEDGDETEIGARGVSLSGGQKARVALARAVYARSKFVLLDDPLSAVDSHTARVIFEKLLMGPLLEGRTVVLVTHHVELVLPGAHYFVRMLDGRIDVQGQVKDLRAQGVLDQLVVNEETHTPKEGEGDDGKVDDSTPAGEVPGNVDQGEAPKKKPRRLIEDEERQTGAIKWSIYNVYLKASSYWTWVIVTILIIAMQFVNFLEKWWIMKWGESYKEESLLSIFASFITSRPTDSSFSDVMSPVPLSPHHAYTTQNSTSLFPPIPDLPRGRDHPLFYVWVYAGIGLSSLVLVLLVEVADNIGSYFASKSLFEKLLNTVVRATMRWHDTTPTGRMLNRFSKDIETIDGSLVSSLEAVNTSFSSFLGSFIVVTIIFPLFILPATILGFLYYKLTVGYLNAGRDLRRMESTTRSPIFSGFGELLEGIVTVRAFSAEQRFFDKQNKSVDVTTKMWYIFWMTNRWLLFNFDFLGGATIYITTLLALSGYVSAGLAGLCITTAMMVTMDIYWMCRFVTQLELDLNSVERIVEYLDLPQEPPSVIDSNRPPAHWPSAVEGQPMIVVENLVVKYAPELPAVLHNVNFELKARERVGLLGRTGSGKSTLAMSMLRFVDPSEGRILVDGIDTTTIGIKDLRSRLTFIPQDATLFSGTLRENLDPFGDYTDVECLDVLYRVQMLTEGAYASQKSSRAPTAPPSEAGSDTTPGPLTAPAANRPASIISGSASVTSTEVNSEGEQTKSKITLDTKVSAGGTNFSQGQRQLIALARALLRQSSVIIMDEATSSIDFETDAKIQKTIRNEFGNSLLLTIAHRLKTVIDYDRLVVLDKGKVAEFDTPWNLIRKEGGIFRHMCLQSGMFGELEIAARVASEGKD